MGRDLIKTTKIPEATRTIGQHINRHTKTTSQSRLSTRDQTLNNNVSVYTRLQEIVSFLLLLYLAYSAYLQTLYETFLPSVEMIYDQNEQFMFYNEDHNGNLIG